MEFSVHGNSLPLDILSLGEFTLVKKQNAQGTQFVRIVSIGPGLLLDLNSSAQQWLSFLGLTQIPIQSTYCDTQVRFHRRPVRQFFAHSIGCLVEYFQ